MFCLFAMGQTGYLLSFAKLSSTWWWWGRTLFIHGVRGVIWYRAGIRTNGRIVWTLRSIRVGSIVLEGCFYNFFLPGFAHTEISEWIKIYTNRTYTFSHYESCAWDPSLLHLPHGSHRWYYTIVMLCSSFDRIWFVEAMSHSRGFSAWLLTHMYKNPEEQVSWDIDPITLSLNPWSGSSGPPNPDM